MGILAVEAGRTVCAFHDRLCSDACIHMPPLLRTILIVGWSFTDKVYDSDVQGMVVTDSILKLYHTADIKVHDPSAVFNNTATGNQFTLHTYSACRIINFQPYSLTNQQPRDTKYFSNYPTEIQRKEFLPKSSPIQRTSNNKLARDHLPHPILCRSPSATGSTPHPKT